MSQDPTGQGQPESRPEIPLVVVGASAGGIDALRTVVSGLPTPFPAAIVIAQHLDPRRVSHLAEILARASPLPVRNIDGLEAIEPGVIYVTPSDRDVEITDHTVSARLDWSGGPRPSVDRLLTSAARIYKDDLIAVILSGSGHDGALGAQAVKAHGGAVIVQNPDTAAFRGMPSAVAPSDIDIVVDAEAIGPLLGDLLGGTYAASEVEPDAELRAFLGHVRERTGVDFSAYKQPTIVRRLQRRMAAVGADTLAEYRSYADAHPEELQRLVASFLIKVTDFFRDPDLFDYLREQVLPQLIADARERGELRLWSAGCATGEEAYSLAMLTADVLGEEDADLQVRIFATDIAADAVEFARRGLYPESALAGLPPDLIERHFQRVDGAFEVRKAVRSMVVFGEHDLGHRAPFPRIDLVLCRNVLIYFTPELQRRALHLFAFSLRPGGRLVLGKAETVNPLPEFFALEQPRLKVYRRVGETPPIPPNRLFEIATPPAPPRPMRRTAVGRGAGLAVGPIGREPSPALQANRLVEGLPVGVATVDRSYHIRTINGAARRLLDIHAIALGDDLIHQAPAALAGALREALDEAFRGQTRHTQHHIPDDPLNADGRDLTITTYPGNDGDALGGEATTAVVVVEDCSPAARRERELEATRDRLADDLARAEARATQAVAELRELRAANQALAATNARLRADHDDLLLASEEAQAAAEEIETLNEELQATNEELETLNEELQATVEELTTTNDELQARGAELQLMATAMEGQRDGRERDRRRPHGVMMGAPGALVVIEGPERLVRLANAPALALRSRSDADAVGRPFADAFPELQAQGVGALLDRVDASGEALAGVASVRIDRAGAEEEVEFTLIAMPLHDQEGGRRGIAFAAVETPEPGPGV